MRYDSNSKANYPVNLVKAIGLSFVTTLLFVIILAIILTFTSLSEGVTPVVNSIIMILSIAFGSIYISFKMDKLGWLHGAVIGLVYIVMVIMLGAAFVESYGMDIYVFFRVLIALVTGSVGGMIGINLR